MIESRVDRYQFWGERPPEPSPRLGPWMQRIAEGWRPNRRLSGMGYDESAQFFGVYIWEYLNIIALMLHPTWVTYDGDADDTNTWLRSFGLAEVARNTVDCTHCSMPYRSGIEPDACLGRIDGAWFACCGHGRDDATPYIGWAVPDGLPVVEAWIAAMGAVGLDHSERVFVPFGDRTMYLRKP